MPETRRLTIGDVRVALRTWPGPVVAKPPVLMLPATGETADDWDVVAADLCADRCVYAMDLRGHGDSDWPGDYSLHRFADDVVGVLDRLPHPLIDLIGHSLGGLVACLVAAQQPATLRRLVVEDVPLPHPREPAMPTRPDGELRFDWEVVGQVRPQVDDPDPTWAEIVSTISVPTLVVAGGPDSPIPQEHVAELADRVPQAHLTTIHAGHLVHARQPERFLSEVRAFLDR